jgi:hypothetical protein
MAPPPVIFADYPPAGWGSATAAALPVNLIFGRLTFKRDRF